MISSRVQCLGNFSCKETHFYLRQIRLAPLKHLFPGSAGTFPSREGGDRQHVYRVSHLPLAPVVQSITLRFLRSTRGAGNTRAPSCGIARSRKAGNTHSRRQCRVTVWVQSCSAHLQAKGPIYHGPLPNLKRPTFPLTPFPFPPFFACGPEARARRALYKIGLRSSIPSPHPASRAPIPPK